MESYFSMLRRKAQAARKKEILAALGEAASAIVFFALLFGICFLCTVCSGYHWE